MESEREMVASLGSTVESSACYEAKENLLHLQHCQGCGTKRSARAFGF